MTVSSKHPLYAEHLEDWQKCRDGHRGERVIKAEGRKYLPATSGMIDDGMGPADKGRQAYEAYKMRARYPDCLQEAVDTLVGVMHRKPPVIELPEQMEYLRESATVQNGEGLEMLLRRINEQQWIAGRFGLLSDPFDHPNPPGPFYIATYRAEDIINWDEGRLDRDGDNAQTLNFVALNETSHERDQEFNWKLVEKYRILVLGDPHTNEPEGNYSAGVFREESQAFNPEALEKPTFTGTPSRHIPFTFINAKDVSAMPDDPPLLPLANLALAIYRGEADYRQSLFMQGQDTLVVMGSVRNTAGEGEDNQTVRTGANAAIYLNQNDDAKYIGVSSEGLAEQRESLQNDYNRAKERAGQLIDTVSREKESGEALSIRVAAKTSTVTRVAEAGAFGLQTHLRVQAMWMGLNPETVKVTPNLDFVDDTMTPAELKEFLGAKVIGAPISLTTIHQQMQKRGVTEFATLEEELAEIEREPDLAFRADDDEPRRNGQEDDNDQED